ncbi:hypothetical protein LXL04_029125 [Taraxacum kok-saghyz]
MRRAADQRTRLGSSKEYTDVAAMDDVDRLFECFKCGISPPRGRKTKKKKLKQEKSKEDPSTSTDLTPTDSNGKKQQSATNNQDDVWATFPRQDEAMKYAIDHGGVHIFSYQNHATGQRRFLVSTYKEFWKRYKSMNPKFRHHYEVIIST